MTASSTLFDPHLPQGFYYRDHFITDREEQALLDAIVEVKLFRMIAAGFDGA